MNPITGLTRSKDGQAYIANIVTHILAKYRNYEAQHPGELHCNDHGDCRCDTAGVCTLNSVIHHLTTNYPVFRT